MADTAVPDCATAVCESNADGGRYQSVHSHARRASDVEDADRKRAEPRVVYAAFPARYRVDSRRTGRRELGNDGRRPDAGRGVRAEHQRAFYLQAEHRGSRAWRRRTARRATGDRQGTHAVHRTMPDLPRRRLEGERELSVPRGNYDSDG